MLSGKAPPGRLSPSTSWRGEWRPAKSIASRPSPSASGRLELRSKSAPEGCQDPACGRSGCASLLTSLRPITTPRRAASPAAARNVRAVAVRARHVL
jgi:hypothetical protein